MNVAQPVAYFKGDVSYDSLADMYYSVAGRYRERAVWLGRKEMLDRLALLTDSAGIPFVRRGLEPTPTDRLFGRPFGIVPELAPDILLFVGM